MWCKLKNKVIRESFEVAFDCTIQCAGANAIKNRKIAIEHHFLAANEKNGILDSLKRNQFNCIIHTCFVIRQLEVTNCDLKFDFSLHTQLALDAEFFDAFAQRGAGDAEHFGGVNLIVVRLLERLDDQFAFDGGDDF